MVQGFVLKRAPFRELSSSAPPVKRSYTTEKDWIKYKDRILQLRRMNYTVPQIRTIILRETGFRASTPQYKHHMKSWGEKRYLTKRERRYIYTQIKEQGKIPTFQRRTGGRLDHGKVSRLWRRRGKYRATSPLAIESHDPRDPIDITVATPSSLGGVGFVAAAPATHVGVEGSVEDLLKYLGITLDYQYQDQTGKNIKAISDRPTPTRHHESQWKDAVGRLTCAFVESIKLRTFCCKSFPNQDEGEETNFTNHNNGQTDTWTDVRSTWNDYELGETTTDTLAFLESNHFPFRADPANTSGFFNEYLNHPNCIHWREWGISREIALLPFSTPIQIKYELDANSACTGMDVHEALKQYDTASDLYNRSELDEARKTLELPLKVLVQELGPVNMRTLTARRLMGIIKRAMMQFKEAQDLLNDTAIKFESTLGTCNFETRWTYYQLASTYLGNYCLQKLWHPIWKAAACHLAPNEFTSGIQSLPQNDALTFKALLIALEAYSLGGHISQATELAIALFDIRFALYNAAGDGGLWAILRLSNSLSYLNLFEQLSTLLHEAASWVFSDSQIVEKDALILELQYRINQIPLLKGNTSYPAELENRFLENLAARQNLYPNDMVGAFKIIQTLGLLNYKRKCYLEAFKYYKDCLSMAGELFGKDHPQTLAVINDLIPILIEQGLLLYARPLSHYALQNIEKWYGPQDSKTFDAIVQASWLTAGVSGLDMSKYRNKHGKSSLDSPY